MDTDNSGVTFDELKAGLRKFGSTLKDTQIRDLMDAVRLLSDIGVEKWNCWQHVKMGNCCKFEMARVGLPT